MSEFIHRYEAGTKPQTILLLHGTGGDENQLMALAAQVFPGANRLGVRGKISEGGANRFFRRFAEGVFDEPNLIEQAGELAKFVKESSGKYGYDRSEVYALGYSNGANIAAALLLLHPETLAGGALLHAMPPLQNPPTPDLTGKRILLTFGERDPIVTAAEIGSLEKTICERHADVERFTHHGGHDLSSAEVERIAQWWLA